MSAPTPASVAGSTAPKRAAASTEKGEKATAKWLEWQVERERLFAEEGQICFDLFAPKSSELLGRCQMLRELVADTHPVVIVDEAQDTGDAAWSCIEKLAGLCQIICLADLDQQIFDHRGCAEFCVTGVRVTAAAGGLRS
ncbi:UvrD-helicase domain-containing protein [Pseudomonas paraeruginosa]|uniref:UvrD-helicase domain-containing protein n=1 Tax=Pseudomonas aeruginosa TaxID=287 RepID=UPI00338F66B7